jgi:hypothetical protein
MLYCNVQLWKYAIWYNKLLTKFSTWSLTVPVLGLRIVNISANATGRSGPFLIWVLVLTASESLLHRQSLSSSIVVFCCHYHILPSWPRWDACCLGTPAQCADCLHACWSLSPTAWSVCTWTAVAEHTHMHRLMDMPHPLSFTYKTSSEAKWSRTSWSNFRIVNQAGGILQQGALCDWVPCPWNWP